MQENSLSFRCVSFDYDNENEITQSNHNGMHSIFIFRVEPIPTSKYSRLQVQQFVSIRITVSGLLYNMFRYDCCGFQMCLNGRYSLLYIHHVLSQRIDLSCKSLRWRHNGRDSVSNHQPYDCLLNGLFRRRSKKTSKLRVTGLCAGNSPGTGEFPAQMASNAENVSIWWRHHVISGRNSK